MDDHPSPASQATFHTPDSHPPPPVQTPGTASSAAAAALPPTSGKKRPLDDASPHNEETGLLGRIVSSITPWKKRGRQSLEGMSGSAIKGAHRTPAGGGNSEGAEGSGKKLRQLNLEQKFESPAVANGGAPAQQAATAGQQQQPAVTGGMELPANKRVRLAGAGRAVTIGGATTFASPPATTAPAASATSGTPGGPSFTDAGTPQFHMGSSTSKPSARFRLRDVRGRTATPGGKMLLAQRRAVAARTATPGPRGALTAGAGATPGARGALAAGGAMNRTASLSSVATTRHSNVGAGRSAGAALSRASGYRRRPIRARSFKPMSRLLHGVYSADDKSNENGEAGKQHTMLTESIASQILEENRNKLGLTDGNGNTELALFGGNAAKSGDAAMDQARTFGEEAANYRAVTKANNVPRVRMNRILGSGQTGGRFHAPAQQSTAMAVAPAPAPLFAAAPAAAAPMAAAPVAQTKKAVTFQSPAKPAADAEMDDADGAAPKPFVPFASDPVLARPTTDPSLKLTPLKSTQEEISKELGEEIEGRTQTEAWQRKAEANFGFDDPNVCTPRKSSAKKAKARGTPHPKKAAATSAANAAAGLATPALLKRADDVAAKAGAPFSFMPGGAAASGTSTATPLGFKFGKATADAPKLAAEESPAPAPAKAAESSPAPAPAASGWGDLFKSKPGEWKCGTCYSPNPKEKTACMACETPKPGADGGGGAAAESTPASGATTNGAKAAAGSIGAGGFSFGGAPAASAPKPAPSSAATGGWSDAFKPKEDEWKCAKCFAKNAKGSDECADCGASKGGAGDKKSGGAPTPAKAKRGLDDNDDVKASIGAGGFSFGGAATASSSAPASVGGAGGIGAGGFSFAGAATKTPANTPAKAKRGRDDDAGKDDSSGTPAAPSVGFAFGTSASAPAPASEAKASVGFSFGAPSASGDEKKEDPASTSTAGAGFSFSAQPALKKKGGGGGGASIPGFAFGAPPASGSKAPAPAEKKEESSEPSSKKQMTFSFGKGGAPSLPVPAGDAAAPAAPGTPGFSFGAASEKKDDAAAAPSGTPAFAFGSSAAAAPTPAAGGFAFGTATEKKDDAASASKPAFGGFGGGAGAPPAEGATKPAFAFGSTPAAAAEKKVESATANQPAFAFGSTPAAAPKPAEAGAAPAFSFGGASAHAPGASASTFAFGAGGASSSTPAPAKPPAPGGAGFAFGSAATVGATPAPTAGGFGGSTPAPAAGGFGSTPAPAPAGGGFGGFGGATGPTPAAAAPATPGGAFSFGAGGSTTTPAAPSAGAFGATPAPATGGFGGFGSAAAPPAAAPATPGFAFGGAPAPTNPTTGFAPAAATPAPAFGGGAGFGATPAAMGGATPGAGGGFSIGTGGAKKTPGTGRTAGRRIVKARRPPGSGR